MSASGGIPVTGAMLACLAALAAGCGAGTSSTSAFPGPLAKPHPHGTVVAIRNGQLLPARVVVIVGHPLDWTNYDPGPHQLRSVSGARFSSPVLGQQAVFSWTPRHPGRIRYRDALGARAVGSIIVVR